MKQTYRFRGGYYNVPQPLLQLIVGRPYEAEIAKDTAVIKAGSNIVISLDDFKKYFATEDDYLRRTIEPSYITEPIVKMTKKKAASNESTRTTIHKVETQRNTEGRISTEIDELQQMTLF
ncbi:MULTISPECIES: hypothetical protein [unclassified Exiguobacterium]|uniref:hypothetical protein n=1 Tax=unclassified Exiguobacterium TaxID=2644629 RepID=UPI001BE6DA86|nr:MULTISPECIES: hypothetical protein [unclassified Exiguobacterium]